MLYNEFLQGTGCRDTDYNYKVYKSLEALYMENDQLTKADIYETGKKLVDNTPSAATLELIETAKKEIENSRETIKYYEGRIETLQLYMDAETDAGILKDYKSSIREYRRQIKAEKGWIARHKFFLQGIA